MTKKKEELVGWTQDDQWLCEKRGYGLFMTYKTSGEAVLELQRVDEPEILPPLDNDFEAWQECMMDARAQIPIAIKCLTYLRQQGSPDWDAIMSYGLAEHGRRLRRSAP